MALWVAIHRYIVDPGFADDPADRFHISWPQWPAKWQWVSTTFQLEGVNVPMIPWQWHDTMRPARHMLALVSPSSLKPIAPTWSLSLGRHLPSSLPFHGFSHSASGLPRRGQTFHYESSPEMRFCCTIGQPHCDWTHKETVCNQTWYLLYWDWQSLPTDRKY
jgi:hypothetical protein